MGTCRFCGEEVEGGVAFDQWVKPTFTDFDKLLPGDAVCPGCLFWFDEASTVLQTHFGKDVPQRIRNYSHFIVNGDWLPLSKADKSAMTALLLNPPFPELAAIASSGQKHIVFRAVRNPPGGFCTLDSGAYGLYQRGGTMDARYILLLANFYRRHTSEAVFAVAPDEFLNPFVSQQRFIAWQQQYAIPVVPVIQFQKMKRLDLYLLLKQSAFYLRYRDALPRWQGRPVVAISNPGLWAHESTMLAKGIELLRREWGGVWLHNLGAGWSSDDIRRWRDLGCFDSIDSIAYYTSAQQHRRWSHVGESDDPQTRWQTLALHNAQVANGTPPQNWG